MQCWRQPRAHVCVSEIGRCLVRENFGKASTLLELNLPDLLQREILSALKTLDDLKRALYNQTPTHGVQCWTSPDNVVQPGRRTGNSSGIADVTYWRRPI